MKKVVRLTESDLMRLVKRVINEQQLSVPIYKSGEKLKYQFLDSNFKEVKQPVLMSDGKKSPPSGVGEVFGPYGNYGKLGLQNIEFGTDKFALDLQDEDDKPTIFSHPNFGRKYYIKVFPNQTVPVQNVTKKFDLPANLDTFSKMLESYSSENKIGIDPKIEISLDEYRILNGPIVLTYKTGIPRYSLRFIYAPHTSERSNPILEKKYSELKNSLDYGTEIYKSYSFILPERRELPVGSKRKSFLCEIIILEKNR